MLLAVPPYFRVLITLHSFMCIRSATRTSNLTHSDKCFSSEDSHTEISKRFAWNALSRWHFISASLHLLYLHMFIVQNHDNYYIIFRLCQCVSSDHLKTISHCNYQIRNQKYLLQILLISLCRFKSTYFFAFALKFVLKFLLT